MLYFKGTTYFKEEELSEFIKSYCFKFSKKNLKKYENILDYKEFKINKKHKKELYYANNKDIFLINKIF